MGPRRGVLILGLLLLAGATVVHLGAQLGGTAAQRDLSQGVLMPALALVVLGWWRPGRVRAGVLVALGFSWIGDVLPKFMSGDAAFLAMVGGFLVAQAVYVVVFWPCVRAAAGRTRGRLRLLVATAVYLPLVIVLSLVLLPHAGTLGAAVLPYAVIIAAMAISAVAVHPVAAGGAALFVVSDALIGLNAFWPPYHLPAHGFWVMLTYIAAQVVLVLGIGRQLVQEEAAQTRARRARPSRTAT